MADSNTKQRLETTPSPQTERSNPDSPSKCPESGSHPPSDAREDRPARQHAGQQGQTRKYPSDGQKKRSDRTSGNQAYLQEFASVPEPAHAFIESLLNGYSDHSVYVFRHILNSGRLNRDNNRFVPLPSRLIYRKKPDADLDALVKAGFLEMRPHDRSRGRCREYRIPDWIMEKYTRISHENLGGKRVNLFTGKRTVRKHKSKTNDRSGNPISLLAKTAIQQIRYGVCNEQAVREHLERLQGEVMKSEADLTIEEMIYGPESSEYRAAEKKCRKALNRYTNDQKCFEILLAQKKGPHGSSAFRYKAAYRIQMSGRITQIGGGAQSASREMKSQIYEDIPNVHNYDIKSSQAHILIDFLEEAGLDSTWLRTYIQTPGAKYKYAERAGLSVDAWKSCLYALFMGATLPQDILESEGSIRSEIEDGVGSEKLEETYERFREVVAPLYETLQAWHKYLFYTWISENSYRGYAGRRYVKNDAEVRLCVDDIENPYELKKIVAAFLLQGREAAYIHNLTLESKRHDFTVVSNEHDGLVTIGEIPKMAVQAVRDALDMDYVQLEEKSFT